MARPQPQYVSSQYGRMRVMSHHAAMDGGFIKPLDRCGDSCLMLVWDDMEEAKNWHCEDKIPATFSVPGWQVHWISGSIDGYRGGPMNMTATLIPVKVNSA